MKLQMEQLATEVRYDQVQSGVAQAVYQLRYRYLVLQ